MEHQLSASLRAMLALKKYGFKTKHSLGQNFITDEDFLLHLLDATDLDRGDNVLEIGPGPGIMTSLIADRCKKIVSIEADEHLRPVLQDVLAENDNTRVIIGDALKADIAAIVREEFGGGSYRVIANLPYYITADLILHMLSVRPLPESICVMVQKEAAERMMSHVGDKNWCAFAAEVSYYAECRILEEVSPDHFDPQPHVTSCFTRLDIRPDRIVTSGEESELIRLIRCCFFMRRKTLANNLKAIYKMNQEKAVRALEMTGLDSRVRGEELSLKKIAALMTNLQNA